MGAERDYVIGTGDAEIARLGEQHELWRPIVADAWTRAGIGNGWSVVDIGAGPGHATLDLAARVGPSGRVLAVERSSRFAAFARRRASALGFGHVAVVERDILKDGVGEFGLDAAWCRWVASFVASPAILVQRIRDALRPGGMVIFHEFVDYGSWRFSPARPAIDAFVEEVMASWRATGGEPDVARVLPALLPGAGFAVQSIRPHVFAVRRGDDMWRWPASFIRAGAARLRELGRVDDEWVRRVVGDIDEAECDATSMLITPMVLEIIARG